MKTAKIPLSQLYRFSVFAGSGSFTLCQLCLLGIAVLLYYGQFPYGEFFLIGALSLTLFNLSCAIITQHSLRSNSGLLLFHIALAALVILAGIGQLTYLKGRLELTQGAIFSGELLEVSQGLLHKNTISNLHFENLGYEVDYKAGLKRNETVNHISWIDEDGVKRVGTIGDQHPLILDGYRFYTSFNKGFSLLFTWEDAAGRVTGTVNLPSYPAREFEQAQYWQVPTLDKVFWTQLVPKENIVTLDEPFVLGKMEDHHVIMRYENERFQMLPGEKLGVAGGFLYYEGARQWMGYKVHYDWTRPWMIAACLIAIAGMMLYFFDKFRSSPVNLPRSND